MLLFLLDYIYSKISQILFDLFDDYKSYITTITCVLAVAALVMAYNHTINQANNNNHNNGENNGTQGIATPSMEEILTPLYRLQQQAKDYFDINMESSAGFFKKIRNFFKSAIILFLTLFTSTFLKWPCLILISLTLCVELMIYLSLRYLIYFLEQFRVYRSHQKLRKKVRFGENVVSYQQWAAAAQQLDEIDNREAWKYEQADPIYNHRIVAKLVLELFTTRQRLIEVVQTYYHEDELEQQQLRKEAEQANEDQNKIKLHEEQVKRVERDFTNADEKMANLELKRHNSLLSLDDTNASTTGFNFYALDDSISCSIRHDIQNRITQQQSPNLNRKTTARLPPSSTVDRRRRLGSAGSPPVDDNITLITPPTPHLTVAGEINPDLDSDVDDEEALADVDKIVNAILPKPIRKEARPPKIPETQRNITGRLDIHEIEKTINRGYHPGVDALDVDLANIGGDNLSYNPQLNNINNNTAATTTTTNNNNNNNNNESNNNNNTNNNNNNTSHNSDNTGQVYQGESFAKSSPYREGDAVNTTIPHNTPFAKSSPYQDVAALQQLNNNNNNNKNTTTNINNTSSPLNSLHDDDCDDDMNEKNDVYNELTNINDPSVLPKNKQHQQQLTTTQLQRNFSTPHAATVSTNNSSSNNNNTNINTTTSNSNNKQNVAERIKSKIQNTKDLEQLVFNLVHIITLSLRQNAAILNEELYASTNVGTKFLIQTFVDEIVESIKCITNLDLLSIQTRIELLTTLHKLYGSNALLLSGGARFAMYHLGLVDALIECDMLDSFDCISGTSAGSLIAAFLATRTKEELTREVLDPETWESNMHFDNGSSTWDKMKNLWQHGWAIDSRLWTPMLRYHCCGDMTFLEAYQKTGKVLVITATSSQKHEPPILLSYITSPHCVIRSACVASATIPFVLPPTSLLFKDPITGQLHEDQTVYSELKDGSFLSDIPNIELAYYFNTTFNLVSQCNPHVSIFYFSRHGASSRNQTGWLNSEFRGTFLLSLIECWLKYDMISKMQIIKEMRLFSLFQTRLGDLSNVFLQNFSGPTGNSVCVVPDTTVRDYLNLFTSPTVDDIVGMKKRGALMLYLKKSLLDSRLKVTKALSDGLKYLEKLQKEQDAQQ